MSFGNLNMNAVIGAMGKEQTVFEVNGWYDDAGRWQSNQLADRTIKAIVVNESVQKISEMTKGTITSGGLAIHTKATLYYQDAMSFTYQANIRNIPGIQALPFGLPTRGQNQPEMIQSFLRYKGRIYRIFGEGFPNANYNTYIAVRYLDYGSDGISL